MFLHRRLGGSNTDDKLSEKEHPSESDSKDHFTTVYEDDDGNHITTKHVYP
jgi:hypothetical protein